MSRRHDSSGKSLTKHTAKPLVAPDSRIQNRGDLHPQIRIRQARSKTQLEFLGFTYLRESERTEYDSGSSKPNRIWAGLTTIIRSVTKSLKVLLKLVAVSAIRAGGVNLPSK